MAYLLWGFYTFQCLRPVWHPPPVSTPPFPLIKSFFFIPPLPHTLRPTVARSLFTRPRDSEGKHKELPTQWRGLWAQRWPLKDVCGLHPDTVAPPTPAQAPPTSGLDLSLNPYNSQNNLKRGLSIVTTWREMSEWHKFSMVANKKTSEESLPCKMMACSIWLEAQKQDSEKEQLKSVLKDVLVLNSLLSAIN